MIMKPDLVSIIIPTYNRAELLLQAIASAQAQTWSNTQIIVVDDGSTDDTREKAEKISGIEYVYQHNAGQAAARNAGLMHAEGEFICSLDSDDLWHPEFLTRCVNGIKRLNADIGFANWISVNERGQVLLSYFQNHDEWRTYPETDLPDWRVIDSGRSRVAINNACVAPSSALIMRRTAMEHGWTNKFQITDDWCMLLDAVMRRPTTIAFTMEPLWTKRIVGDNIHDHRTDSKFIRQFYVHDYGLIVKRFADLHTPDERALWHGRLAIGNFKVARACVRAKNWIGAAGNTMQGAIHYLKCKRLRQDLAEETLALIKAKKATGLKLADHAITGDTQAAPHAG